MLDQFFFQVLLKNYERFRIILMIKRISSWSCTIQKIFISKNADTADDEDQDEGKKEEKNLVVTAIIILMILSFT
ncbi:unnamed protein product [Rhizophagus irregularis]|nr:unnamed protein product [Rhizophagus irregularis]